MSDSNGKPKNFKLLGIGNPLLDIIAQIDEAFLKKNNVKMSNAILIDESQIHIYEEMKSTEGVKFMAGGCSLNTTRVCQWILNKKHPNVTAYMGCIGKDENGRLLKSATENNGIDTFFMESSSEPTGVCGVGLMNKERTLITNLAAANKFVVSHLDKTEAVYKNADYVYISGFFLTVSIETILKVAKFVSSQNKIFSLNVSADFLVEAFEQNLTQALFFADYVFMNEQEALCFAKNIFKNEKLSLPETARKISLLPKSNANPRTTIITRGKNSTFVDLGGYALINVNVEFLEESEIVDLNGAGDAFVGGFLAGRIRGDDLVKCVQLGHKAARCIICKSGVSVDGDFVE